MEASNLAPGDVNVAQANTAPAVPGAKKIVLCFDGTSNQYNGNASDTNVVKIFEMLERNTDDQYHYYQPGIGTRPIMPLTPKFASLRPANIRAMLDQGFAFSFKDHVIGGYRFLMQTYMPGDKVYIFGFSRGSYTARFLAEMVQWIGLLSRGNEELIEWCWTTFSEFQKRRDLEGFDNPDPNSACAQAKEFMMKFKSAFCRQAVDIHFIGLFDCVNSVAQLESPFKRTKPYIPVPFAKHIRHAVSLHERRMKFRPALLESKEFRAQIDREIKDKNNPRSTRPDLKEVYFAGNHGDVGGGWGLQKGANGAEIPYLLSDISLKWMIDELRKIDKLESVDDVIKEFNSTIGAKMAEDGRDPKKLTDDEKESIRAQHYQDIDHKRDRSGLSWQWLGETGLCKRAKLAEDLEAELYKKCEKPPSYFRHLMHDPLRLDGGCTKMMVMFWWLFEILPFGRYELDKKDGVTWRSQTLPPTYGAYRDRPPGFDEHHSVELLHKALIILDKEMPHPRGKIVKKDI